MVAEELDVPTSAICMVAAQYGTRLGSKCWLLGSLNRPAGNAPLPVPGLPSHRPSRQIYQVWPHN